MADEERVDLRERTTAARVVAGGLWSALAGGLAPFLLLVQSVVAARFLGPTRMGQQSFIAWVELTAALVLSAGTAQTLNRYVGATAAAHRGAEMRSVLGTLTRLQVLVSGVPVLVFSLAIAPHQPSALQAPWVLAGVGAGLLIAQAVPAAMLTALQQWRRQAVISLTTGALATVATVIVLALGGGLTGMFAVESAAFCVSGVWSTRRARMAIAGTLPAPVPAPELRREVFRYAVIATCQSTLAYLVWQRSEFVFLEHYGTASEIAVYSIAFATVLGLQRLPEGLTQTLVPSLAVLVGGAERERLRLAVARAMRLMWTLSAPLAAGLMAVGPRALRLVYGADYSGTGSVVVVLVLALPAVLVARVAASVLHASGRVRTVLACLSVGIAVDVALCLLLIPRHGAIGAAIANTSAQVTVAVLEIGCARAALGALDGAWWHQARATFAAVGCGGAAYGVVWAVPGVAGLVAAIAAGAVSYALLLRAMRPVTAADREWLFGLAGPRLRSRLGRVVTALIA